MLRCPPSPYLALSARCSFLKMESLTVLLFLSMLAAHVKALPVSVSGMGPARSRSSQNAFLFNGIYQEYTYPGKVCACFSRVFVYTACDA